MSGYNASSESVLSFMLSTDSVRSGHDAFDALPDPLISIILPKLPLKEAIRSCVLSKRWRLLHTQMPAFTFPQTTSSDIISKMLLHNSGNLESFHIDTTRQGYSPDDVFKWVQYASEHNLKHLTLSDGIKIFARHLEEIPPSSLLSCSSLLTLRLRYYILTSFPTGFKGFAHLISCYLSTIQMTDESLTSLLKFCPLLQILEMIDCFGLTHAVISSSTIENLDVTSGDGVQSVFVDCPKLKIMKAFMIEDLRVNGALFYELSYAVSHLEMYGGDTLRKVLLESLPEHAYLRISPARFLDILEIFQSLQELTIAFSSIRREQNMQFLLFELLHGLPNLQMFFILGLSIQETAVPVFLTPPHLNLKKISIEIFEFGHKEVEMISCFLQSTPSLEILEIQQLYEDDEDQYLMFLENIRFLK